MHNIHTTNTVIVVGEKPDEMMAKFNRSLEVEKYLKYSIDDSKFLRSNAIITIEKIIESFKNNNQVSEKFNGYLSDIKEMTDVEYYSYLTKNLLHDEYGNAWSNQNPNGKWTKYQIGKDYCYPLIKHNGEETFQCRKHEVDWTKMHLTKKDLYGRTWDIVVDNQEPQNDNEKNIKTIMSSHKDYLLNFNNKENYIKYCASYWNYAILKDGKWEDCEYKLSFDWVTNFYEKYIAPLNDNELITIYEYQDSYDV